MKRKLSKQTLLRVTVSAAISLLVLIGAALAAQDRFTLKAPNGIAFSEFRGFQNRRDVAESTFGKTVRSQCHTRVKARDYIFTNHPFR